MYQQERMDEIMKILKQHHYVTVDHLVGEIRYSPASIRRDLTLLEKQGLVTRSYGGVTLKEANLSPFRFRQHSMKLAKNAIAKRAASLVKNGDTVFLDGSSSTQYIGHFLTEKKGITVITCNLILANFLSEHGITTYCTGGRVVEYPGILGGPMMLESLSKFRIEIGFFSSLSFRLDGTVMAFSEQAVQTHQMFRQYCKTLVFLCGSDKIDTPTGKFVSLSLDDVDYFVSNGELPEQLRRQYPNTTFLCTKLADSSGKT